MRRGGTRAGWELGAQGKASGGPEGPAPGENREWGESKEEFMGLQTCRDVWGREGDWAEGLRVPRCWNGCGFPS